MLPQCAPTLVFSGPKPVLAAGRWPDIPVAADLRRIGNGPIRKNIGASRFLVYSLAREYRHSV